MLGVVRPPDRDTTQLIDELRYVATVANKKDGIPVVASCDLTRHRADITAGDDDRRMPRREDTPLLTGRGRFVDDVVRPDLLHVAFVRSPYARGRIRAVDTSAAVALPGVAQTFRGEIKGTVEDASGAVADHVEFV